jgi:hypothetical protein
MRMQNLSDGFSGITGPSAYLGRLDQFSMQLRKF